jgi:glycosyltransferase involved in cell wall biosynthesis
MLTGEYPPQPGGVGDYTARLAAALCALGHKVRVLTSGLPGAKGTTEPQASRRVRDWGFGCWRAVQAAVEESGADLLHIQYQAGAYQLKGAVNLLPLWLRRRRPGLRTVTSFHDLRVPYLFPKAGPLRGLAVRALLRGSHGAIFVDSADLARAGPGPNRRWIPIGSNIPFAPPAGYDRFATRRALGAEVGDLLIGYFGFLSASKGGSVLLEALRLLLNQGRSVRLVLIGATSGATNPTDRIDVAATSALAGRLGLESRLYATGYLAQAAVSANMLACDVLALPYEDGASFRRGSLLAALEHGRPIVTTTPAPGARGFGPRSLIPERHFLPVPPNDPAALAHALTRLADDPELAARLGGEAKRLAGLCSWESIAAETAEVYAEVRRTVDRGSRARA